MKEQAPLILFFVSALVLVSLAARWSEQPNPFSATNEETSLQENSTGQREISTESGSQRIVVQELPKTGDAKTVLVEANDPALVIEPLQTDNKNKKNSRARKSP